MENYVFVCIGTNKLIQDSFGPRVGELLEKSFQNNSFVNVFGTMQTPVHFQNASIFLEKLETIKSSKIILIDSAFGENENIGNTYVSFGGAEIGKAFGKSFYFPAHLNIKTVVGNLQSPEENKFNSKILKEKNVLGRKMQNVKDEIQNNVSLNQINKLACQVAQKITQAILL